MDLLLHQVISLALMSMLDGLSRYNQVLVAKDERHKIAIMKPWSMYAYIQM